MKALHTSQVFASGYPDAPAKLSHDLCGHPLLTREALQALARELGPAGYEYNRANLAPGHDPGAMPKNGLSIEETIDAIETCGSWIVFIAPERSAPYRALMNECLADIAPHADRRTGPPVKPASFIFLSSPGAVSPFHMDPEFNILAQIGGEKRFSVYRTDFSDISAERHEKFHAEGMRDIGYRQDFEQKATAFDLAAGDAVYVPLKAPHVVTVTKGVSISYSVTWRTPSSIADARLHKFNHRLRRLGARPPLPGAAPARDAAKVLAERAIDRFSPRDRA